MKTWRHIRCKAIDLANEEGIGYETKCTLVYLMDNIGSQCVRQKAGRGNSDHFVVNIFNINKQFILFKLPN